MECTPWCVQDCNLMAQSYQGLTLIDLMTDYCVWACHCMRCSDSGQPVVGGIKLTTVVGC